MILLVRCQLSFSVYSFKMFLKKSFYLTFVLFFQELCVVNVQSVADESEETKIERFTRQITKQLKMTGKNEGAFFSQFLQCLPDILRTQYMFEQVCCF